MKKAGLISLPKDKISLSKTGQIKLEESLVADRGNLANFCLPWALDAHAGKIVKSHALFAARMYIRQYFGKLSRIILREVIDYSKTSIFLRAEDFKTASE